MRASPAWPPWSWPFPGWVLCWVPTPGYYPEMIRTWSRSRCGGDGPPCPALCCRCGDPNIYHIKHLFKQNSTLIIWCWTATHYKLTLGNILKSLEKLENFFEVNFQTRSFQTGLNYFIIHLHQKPIMSVKHLGSGKLQELYLLEFCTKLITSKTA